MLIKTSLLSGAALDWAVAECEGLDPHIEPTFDGQAILVREPLLTDFFPSSNWAQGGPIIEREGITLSKTAHGFWEAHKRPATPKDFYQCDDFPLIAAMRCYVASKLGDNIDIPEELL